MLIKYPELNFKKLRFQYGRPKFKFFLYSVKLIPDIIDYYELEFITQK